MSAGHGAGSISDGLAASLATPVRRVDAAVKLVCLLGVVIGVVATPPTAIWAFGVHGLLIGSAAVVARMPPSVLGRRLVIEVPFVAFALALPFVGPPPDAIVAGLSLSVAGAWAAWGIVVKATLGVAAASVLAWSTPVAELLAGLDRLRVPRVLTAIAGFMVRYVDVVAAELRRLQVARVARGDDPRWLWQGRTVAATAGTMFVRCFERGERVQQAMVARGFTGTFPETAGTVRPLRWWPAVAWPAIATATALVARLSP